MRNLTFLLILCVSFSCQRKDNEVDNRGLSYSVETVIIDSKGRLFDLKRRIFTSDLSDNEQKIYLYNSFDHSIDVVDLDKLEFADHLPLEVEGPNGIGDHVNDLNLLKDGRIFLKSFYKSGLFDSSGNLLQKIDWLNAEYAVDFSHSEIAKTDLLVGPGNLKVFRLNYNNQNREVFLDILSFQNNTVQRHDVDPEKSYHDFVLANDDPQNYTFFDPWVYLNNQNNLIIISHDYSNELVLFSPQGEFLKVVGYDPELTPKRVRDFRGSSTSRDRLLNEYQLLLEQVRFGPPVWDRNNNRYLRLSATRSFTDNREEGALLPEGKETKVFLTILDAEFNLVAETAIPELKSETAKYFAKDGKLWVYENFSDELGFIIVDI